MFPPPSTQVRGSTAPPDELSYITTQSGAVGLVLQDEETLCKLIAKMRHQQATSDSGSHPITALQHLKFVVLLYPSARPASPAVQQQLRDSLSCDVLQYADVMKAGQNLSGTLRNGFQPVPCALSDLATLVYTSGTTGEDLNWHSNCGVISHQRD